MPKPVLFAMQANVASGPRQIGNGTSAPITHAALVGDGVGQALVARG